MSTRKAIPLFATVLFVLTSPAFAVDTIVVCPAAFRDVVGTWIKYRVAQGHQIQILPSSDSSDAIRNAIRRIASAQPVKTVVLVGDAPGLGARQNLAAGTVPVNYVRSRVITKYGGEDHIASDNGYADLDGDEIPDLAIGRLPADTPQQLSTVIEKIVSYETNPDFGTWRRQVNLIAGVGGLGPLIDRVVESTTKMFLTSGIPSGFQTTMTQASWTSPYCPDPRRFSATTIGRLNEGCLFWVYMGHGYPQGLDQLIVPQQQFPIMTNQDVPNVRCRTESPIALFFCCYTGAFDAGEDCLAEQLVSLEKGPVAAIAGSRVTMPYAMAVLGSGMLNEYFLKRRETIGQILLHAKRQLAKKTSDDSRRKMLDSIAGLLSAYQHDLADERLEHLHLFNLLGDPLLRLRRPQPVEVSAPRQVEAGSNVTVAANTPVAGRAIVELTLRRDRLPIEPPTRTKFEDADDNLAAYDDIYHRVNDLRLTSAVTDAAEGPFEVRLPIPQHVEGTCHFRVFVQGATDFAVGSSDVTVSKPSAKASDQTATTR